MRLLLLAALSAAVVCLFAPVAETRTGDGSALQPEWQGVLEPLEGDGSLTQFVEIDAAKKGGRAGVRVIKGKIKLDGTFYDTRCDCQDPLATSQCHEPVKMRVHQHEFNAQLGLSKEDLKSMLGKPSGLAMIRAERASLADVDPRQSLTALCVPGGDFGEFLRALAVMESYAGRDLTETEVKDLLAETLDALVEPMYYNTDDAAIEHLQKHLHVDGATGVVVGLQITNPPQPLREEILRDVVKSENQGSPFLQALLTSPSSYMVREGLAQHAIRALLSARWSATAKLSTGALMSSMINVQTQEGPIKAKAWVDFRGSTMCEEERRFPTFNSRSNRGYGERQVYVNNPTGGVAMRRTLAEVFTGAGTVPTTAPPPTAAEFNVRLDRLARRHTEMLASTVASMLPVYTVVVE